ncbi:hypothetical protein J6S55_02060 [Candidatus Saccharibacteria bacterium]|nr:hypothetical protein [Candidatus Saccharibacteria bacterium]
MSDKNRRQLFTWLGVGSVVIFILLVVLIALINSDGGIPKDAYVADEGLMVGEIQNAEVLEKVRVVLEKEPVLSKLPLTVEFYTDDYSSYTKYTISYAFDFSKDRGFYLIMKDYTGAGIGAALRKLNEMGMDTIGLELKYENLEDESLSPRAE